MTDPTTIPAAIGGAPPRQMPAPTPEDHARLARAAEKRQRRAARRMEVTDGID